MSIGAGGVASVTEGAVTLLAAPPWAGVVRPAGPRAVVVAGVVVVALTMPP